MLACARLTRVCYMVAADMANVWAFFRHPSGASGIAPGTPPLGSPRESLLAGPGLPLPRRRSSPLPQALSVSTGASKGKLT